MMKRIRTSRLSIESVSETLLIVGAERFSNYTVFEEAHLGR